jgi:hypothetical protein
MTGKIDIDQLRAETGYLFEKMRADRQAYEETANRYTRTLKRFTQHLVKLEKIVKPSLRK